eukprot:TRINITY_DN742_c0_g1_i4.p1 TRINITY_DN742_c0_g1~~TRINITY_DN742_c0_g1_i4.p1  ORF type:complete len:488 (+),score=197.68 TRINITY_DN742_c0_g1_i4:102-1466(+)
MPVHLSVHLPTVAVVIGGLMLSTIALTYTLCVHQDHCPKFLPTISDTWVYPPENYVSRWVVGNVCILMGLCQYALFWIDAAKVSACWNKALLVIGFSSCVLLSFVGAVCDSKVPSCRGNNSVHSTAAVSFFVGYNFCMVVISCWKGAAPTETVLAAVSLLSKVRFSGAALQRLGAVDSSFPLLAVVEWTDVAAIVGWTVLTLARKGAGMRMAVLNRSTGDDTSALSFWSMRFCMSIVTIWYLGTLASTALIYHLQGRWPEGGMPFISDTWVYPPGNWISRWAVVGCATVGIFVHVCAYFLEADDEGGVKGGLSRTILAAVAMLGVSVVGCVDESEDIVVHATAAVVFFGGYDLFMVLTSVHFFKKHGCSTSVPAAAAALISVASKLRFHETARGSLESVLSYLPQILEWADALSIIVFFLVFTCSFGAKTKSIGLALLSEQQQGKKVAPLLAEP